MWVRWGRKSSIAIAIKAIKHSCTRKRTEKSRCFGWVPEMLNTSSWRFSCLTWMGVRNAGLKKNRALSPEMKPWPRALVGDYFSVYIYIYIFNHIQTIAQKPRVPSMIPTTDQLLVCEPIATVKPDEAGSILSSTPIGWYQTNSEKWTTLLGTCHLLV